MSTATKLKALRAEHGANQGVISDATGISRSSLSQYENGMRPPLDACILLAQYYGVSLDWLVDLSQDRRPQGGRLAEGFTALAAVAGENTITAQTVADVLDAARAYYRHGAPCGTVPLDALRGFLSGAAECLDAAARGDAVRLMDAADAATIAALGMAKMPALFLAKTKGDKK